MILEDQEGSRTVFDIEKDLIKGLHKTTGTKLKKLFKPKNFKRKGKDIDQIRHDFLDLLSKLMNNDTKEKVWFLHFLITNRRIKRLSNYLTILLRTKTVWRYIDSSL